MCDICNVLDGWISVDPALFLQITGGPAVQVEPQRFGCAPEPVNQTDRGRV